MSSEQSSPCYVNDNLFTSRVVNESNHVVELMRALAESEDSDRWLANVSKELRRQIRETSMTLISQCEKLIANMMQSIVSVDEQIKRDEAELQRVQDVKQLRANRVHWINERLDELGYAIKPGHRPLFDQWLLMDGDKGISELLS